MDLPPRFEVNNQFHLFAVNEKVHIGKLNQLLKSLKLSAKDTQLAEIIEELEPDKEGKFTLDRFRNIKILNPDVEEYYIEDVINSLTIFDEDNDGKLTVKELQRAMTQFGEDVTEADGGGNTKMNMEEFTQMKMRL